MNSEYRFIENILKKRRQSPRQHNAAFSSDAEIISLGESLWAVTVDDFSPEEDFFKHAAPETIGWNLAIATLSDLFACGVNPDFFLQVMVVSQLLEEEFYERLMSGINDALKQCNCFLLGGDTGRADAWRYTGIALGQVEKGCQPVSRKITCREPLNLYLTGYCGDANIAVFNNDGIPRFESRMTESAQIRRFASAGIDTSGGVCDALWNLKRLNPAYDFKIDTVSIPYSPNVKETLKNAALPDELALIGGAGEYELLAAVPRRVAAEFEKNGHFTRIGTIRPVDGTGTVLFTGNKQHGYMKLPPPCYRFCDPQDYLKITLEYYRNLFLLEEDNHAG